MPAFSEEVHIDQPNFQFDSTPVTLASREPWHSGYPPWELCNMLNALKQPDSRIIQAGAVKKMWLDARSRARDDNRLELTGSRKIATARKINKTLAMELVTGSLLTFVGTPRDASSHCVTNYRGKPNNVAQGGKPDIVYRPANTNPSFHVVCEVSANGEMKDEGYRDQLETGLRHAGKEHHDAGVEVTYRLQSWVRLQQKTRIR